MIGSSTMHLVLLERGLGDMLGSYHACDMTTHIISRLNIVSTVMIYQEYQLSCRYEQAAAENIIDMKENIATSFF